LNSKFEQKFKLAFRVLLSLEKINNYPLIHKFKYLLILNKIINLKINSKIIKSHLIFLKTILRNLLKFL